jgi:pilus assembly protein CpaF
LQAMNTGHDGSLSTCHANTPADALRRVETLVLMSDVALPLAAVREQVASALDLVVHMERTVGGARRVVAVDEVVAGHDPTEGSRTIALSDDRGLHTLPTRSPREIGAGPPLPAWRTPC